MNDGAVTRDVIDADGAVDAPRGIARRGEQRATADRRNEVIFVGVDARGRQINPLPTTMTAAEALEDSLGPRR